MSTGRWTALVGSELQLLSLLEAHELGLLGAAGTDTYIAGRYTPHADLLASLERRGITYAPLTPRRLAATMSSRRVAVGDPFGRAAHARLATGRLDAFIVLEDGLATVSAISQTVKRRALTRPRLERAPLVSRAAAPVAARTRNRLADQGQLHWVVGHATADLVQTLGCRDVGEVHEHRFSALRTLPVPVLTTERAVRHLVVGSSYATNGLIDREFYRHWLRAACADNPDHTLFIAHPRDLPDARTIAREAGATVGETGVSVERLVLALSDLTSIRCLPSSPALTLASLGYGARLEVTPIADHHWCDTTPAAFRDLGRLAMPIPARIPDAQPN